MDKKTWEKGGPSPNPKGRRKYKNGGKTIKGRIERWLKGKMTPNELNRIYEQLTPKEQVSLFTELLPFVAPKMTAGTLDLNLDKMTDSEVEDVYARLFNQVNSKLSLDGIPEAEVIPEPELIPLPQPEKTFNNGTAE